MLKWLCAIFLVVLLSEMQCDLKGRTRVWVWGAKDLDLNSSSVTSTLKQH